MSSTGEFGSGGTWWHASRWDGSRRKVDHGSCGTARRTARLAHQSRPPRALPALGSDPAVGREPRRDRGHDRGVRPGTCAALPERQGTIMSIGWTGRTREAAVRALPPGKLLPDEQPAYVASWIYVFGVVTIAALVVVLASGAVLGLKGPAWWHTSSVGHFFNSIH